MIADCYEEVHYTIDSISTGTSPSFFVSTSSFIPSIRTDIALTSTHDIRLWGQLRASNKLPLYGVKIELTQITFSNGSYQCNLVTDTLTDESGFYFFDLTGLQNVCYQLIIHSKNTLNNKILNPEFNPCHMHQSMCLDCQKAILTYLKEHSSYPFGYEHFISCITQVPILTTCYALPQYR